MSELTFILEIVGTIAFSVSGAMTGMKKNTDLLGVIVLGIITATGGGITRDLLLGILPPESLRNPIYVIVATITALLVFLFFWIREKRGIPTSFKQNNLILQVMDSIGLGVFTVVGLQVCWNLFPSQGFLCVLSGVITGVGGGLLRDMIVCKLPDIFSKHIYAMAAIFGALVSLFFMNHQLPAIAQISGIIVVVVIRQLAYTYEWDLPKLKNFSK